MLQYHHLYQLIALWGLTLDLHFTLTKETWGIESTLSVSPSYWNPKSGVIESSLKYTQNPHLFVKTMAWKSIAFRQDHCVLGLVWYKCGIQKSTLWWFLGLYKALSYFWCWCYFQTFVFENTIIHYLYYTPLYLFTIDSDTHWIFLYRTNNIQQS